MLPDSEQKKLDARAQMKMRLAILAFGCAVLAFLVAIDHGRWFELRPASGTALAMFHAGHPDSRAVQPGGH